MWEIPFYIIGAPLLTLITILFCSFKLKNYWLGPILVFVLLNIPTITLPFYYSVGWGALFGWAVFYTVIGSLIALIIWFMRTKNARKS